MIGFLKRLFCKHDLEYVRNVYGDEINYLGGKRSIWKCAKCDKYELKDQLHSPNAGASPAPARASEREARGSANG